MATAAWSAKVSRRAISRSWKARGIGLPTDSTPITFPADRSGTARPATIPTAAFRARISGVGANRSSARMSLVHMARPSAAARPTSPLPAGTIS
jgi:hypothetical protein